MAETEAHLRKIILALFNPMPDRHLPGCLAHGRGPCQCGYSELAGEYLWALREAKVIAGKYYGSECVEKSARLKEPRALVDAAQQAR